MEMKKDNIVENLELFIAVFTVSCMYFMYRVLIKSAKAESF